MPTINIENYKKPPQFKVDKLLNKPAIDFQDEAYEYLLDDLQANILKHHRKENVKYLFIKFKNINSAYDCVSKLAELVPSAKAQLEGKEEYSLNVFLTHEGYQYLGIPDTIIPNEEAFRMGIKNRTKLEDLSSISLNAAHIIVFYAGNSKKEITKIGNKVKSILAKTKLIHEEEGIIDNPLHKDFQVKDGISNPKYFPGATSSNSSVIAPSQISPLNLVLHSDKGGGHEFSCGSYGTFLKFLVDEKALDTLVTSVAKTLSNKKKKVTAKDKEKVLALIFGRFKDGTPLTLHEEPQGKPVNNFDYKEYVKAKRVDVVQTDDQGSRCPFHTHVRKANPRTKDSEKYQITRRGMYYKNSKNQKGLLFSSFQRSLAHQFEFVLNNWMLNDYTDLNDEAYNTAKLIKTKKDILFAQKGDKYDLPKTWNAYDNGTSQSITIEIKKALIQYLGGIYYYVPSISFLKKIIQYKAGRAFISGQKTIPSESSPPFLEGTEIFLSKGKEVYGKSEVAFLPNTSMNVKPKK